MVTYIYKLTTAHRSLGPLFANFYMADLDNDILEKPNDENKPSVCCRYVGDHFFLIPNDRILHKLI